MAVVFTEYRQAGTKPPAWLFERELVDLCVKVGRPVPELKGAKLQQHPDGDRTWLVVCTLRGSEVAPHYEEITLEVLERTWEEGCVRVMQQALARLVCFHRAQLMDSPYRYFGARDSEGYSVLVVPHPHFGYQLQNMECLLRHTQRQMDGARMTVDLQKTEISTLTQQLTAAQEEAAKAKYFQKITKNRNRRLLKKMRDSDALLLAAEAKVEELEEECAELRKSNDEILDDHDNDAAQDVDFDMEPQTDQEDDDHRGDGDEDEDEEDPEELVPEPDTEETEEPAPDTIEEAPVEAIPTVETVVQEDSTAHHNGIIYE